MSEERERRGGAPAVVFAGAVLLVAPLLYALSSGPSLWLVDKGYVSGELDTAVYSPLEWVKDAVPPFSEAMNWYESCFVDF